MKNYRHKQIRSVILERLEQGVYAENQQIPKSKALATEFRTSSVTIDRALSGLADNGYLRRIARKGTFVNPRSQWGTATQRAVPTASVVDIGSDGAATVQVESVQTTGRGRGSGIVALIVHDEAVPYHFWTKALRGIEDALSRHGIHVIVGSNNLTIDRIIRNIEDLNHKGIDGLIYVPIGASTEHEYEEINGGAIATLERLEVPHILLNRHVTNSRCSFVVGDEGRSAESLTNALLDSGVSNPICITQHYITPFADRELGFRQVLAQRGFTDIDQRVVHVLPYPQQIDDRHLPQFVEILRRTEADGVFSVNNHILSTVLKAADLLHQENGHTVQAVNYDSVDDDDRRRIVRTAVPQAYNMGYIAAELLVSLKLRWRETVFRVYEPCVYTERQTVCMEATADGTDSRGP